MLPLLVPTLGGLAISAAGNLASQYTSRQLYNRQINNYQVLQNGYNRYLASLGRTANPARMYNYYGSKIDNLATARANSYWSTIGTVGGSVGAGAGMTYRWL